MKKNDILTLTVDALTNEGSGVGRFEGMAVFVPFTAAGDVISCRVLKVLKSYAYGKAEEVLTPSPDRVENDCPAFGKCGGCVFRHISYKAELAAKDGFVRDAFRRIGGLAPEFLPICGSGLTEGYRNKLQMPLAKSADGGVVSGFFSERSHRIVPVDACRLQPPVFAEIVDLVKEQAVRLGISIYNEERHEGVLRHIYLRRGHCSGEVCVTLVARRKTPELKKLADVLAKRFPEIRGVVLNVNPDRTNVILGEREEVLRGSPVMTDTMCGLTFEMTPGSFYQVNTPAAERLYEQAAGFAELGEGGKTVLDLYCGTGTIGLSMAARAKLVVGAEIVPEAVENARRNAELNGFSNTEFICADAGEATKKLAKKGLLPDVILLDPPRKGCSEETLAACVSMSPERIVMISCNPATAARDCKYLSENGYTAKAVRAFDLFPRTKHVECVTLLEIGG
ncbi:MAG: 23S rRNA (uracil(1939)-C(5))-methyltransferase RlmD [Lachnospiraceae bacterium]|nr:23S rRNA (uracil(1939)-C(5))-methyltransferase RlmD [Lachnospiraceae bacterium]